MRSVVGMVSITEKMANMQSTYDQNAGPIDDDMTNDSNSNFQATAFQIEDSNINILKTTNDQYQSSQAVKDVIPDQGSYVNKKQIKPKLLIDNAILNPESNVTQDQIQSRQFLNNVIGNQELHVNHKQDQHEQLQDNTIPDTDAHMIHEQVQSQMLLANKDQKDVIDHERVQIQPETIISQPDIDYITMTTSDDDEEDILTVEKQKWAPPSITDREKLLYDKEFKAYKLSSIQLKAAKAMLVREVAELEHKSVKQMLKNPKATMTAYTDIFVERDFLTPLYLSSFIVDSPRCNDKFKCNACNTEYKNRQS